MATGAAIKYGTESGTYNLTSSPEHKNVGTYTVYFEITREGYTTVSGSEQVVISKKAATVETGSASKVYDGSALTNSTVTLGGIIVEDDVTAAATGSQTAVGSSNNTVTIGGVSAGNYDFTNGTTLGTLTVNAGTIEYTSEGYTGVYDMANHGITVVATGAAIKYGTESGTYNLTSSPEYRNVGTYTVYFEITREGYTTVSGSEQVVISKKAATVETGSASKVYDGSALTNSIVTLGGIIVEDDVTAAATGSQTAVGSSNNTVTIGGVSAGNYDFTNGTTLGTLTVNAGTIEYTSEGYTGVYDMANHGITVVATGAAIAYSETEDGTYTSTNPEYTNAGTYTVYFEITREGYTTVTGSEQVVIGKKAATVETGSSSRRYNGSALTNSIVTLGGIIAEDDVTATATGSQTAVGSSNNTVTIGGISAENYDFTDGTTLGTLTVVRRGSNHRNDDDVTILEEETPAGPLLNMVDHYAYIQGYPDDTVRPQGNITREEVAAVFFRLLDPAYRETIRTTDENFSDVAESRWSAKHIGTLSNGQILTGYQDGNFKPGAYMTKAELAAVASRFDNLSTPGAITFSDVSGHWAEKYILSAAEKGWVKGYEDGTFKPDQYVTRAEFVTLVNNVLNRKVHTENILSDALQFPDLEKGKWYYEAMQEAINSHNYDRAEDSYEVWTEIYYPVIEM